MPVISKITMPTGNSYDIRDNKAGHYLGITSTDVTANEKVIGASIVIGTSTYYLNPGDGQTGLRDQDIVSYGNLVYIAHITNNGTTNSGTWEQLTFAPEAVIIPVEGVTVDGTSIVDGTSKIADIDTTGVTSGTGATLPYASSTNPVATKAYVDTTVEAAVAELPQAMIFRGSLGTGGTETTLPTATVDTVGNVYKVITAGTYATQAAKVGDLFIGTEVAGDPVTYAWTLIPSGDEENGTVTSIGVARDSSNNPKGLKTDQTSSGPITTSGTLSLDFASGFDTNSSVASATRSSTAGREYGLELDSNGKLAVNVPWTDTTYTFDANHAYDASTNPAATVGTVTGAIGNIIAGTTTGTAGANATITEVTQSNGSVSVTYTPIAVASSQVTSMGSYDKDAEGATGAISTSDSLNVAVAKLENALDGKQGTLTFDGTYDASDNKVATESTVSGAIRGAISSTTATINGVSATSGNIVTGLGASTTPDTGAINLVEVQNETLTIKYLNPSTTAVTQTTNVLLKAPTT